MAATLADAFRDYPVMRFVLGDEGAYEDRLARLVGLFVAGRSLRDDPLLGVVGPDGIRAAATMSDSRASAPAPRAFLDLRDRVWGELGAAARERYERCVAAWGALGIDRPHLHVNMLGVRRAHRGTGLARLLLDHAQARSLAAGTDGVTLTTEDPLNVPFYEHMGYRVTGRARVAPELETWALFRDNREA